MDSILDCGDAAGYALAALRLGFKAVRYDGPATERVAKIAEHYNARIIPDRPVSLDLDEIETSGGNMEAACAHWLQTYPV